MCVCAGTGICAGRGIDQEDDDDDDDDDDYGWLRVPRNSTALHWPEQNHRQLSTPRVRASRDKCNFMMLCNITTLSHSSSEDRVATADDHWLFAREWGWFLRVAFLASGGQ